MREFERAYEGLKALVEQMVQGEVREEVLREEVDAWRREDCRGAGTLSNAAREFLTYELANRGLEGDECATCEMSALRKVEAILEPPEALTGTTLVEVALPEELRRKMPNGRGFRMGELQILFEPVQGPPHAHLSVAHPSRYPTWEEILRARTAPGGPSPNLWAWVPKPEAEDKMNSRTIHLYALPPEELLG